MLISAPEVMLLRYIDNENSLYAGSGIHLAPSLYESPILETRYPSWIDVRIAWPNDRTSILPVILIQFPTKKLNLPILKDW